MESSLSSSSSLSTLSHISYGDHLLPVLACLDLRTLMVLKATSKEFNRLVSGLASLPPLIITTKHIREQVLPEGEQKSKKKHKASKQVRQAEHKKAQQEAMNRVYDKLMQLQAKCLLGVTTILLDDVGLADKKHGIDGYEPWLDPERRGRLLQAIASAAPNVITFTFVDGNRSLGVHSLIYNSVSLFPALRTLRYHHYDEPSVFDREQHYTAEGYLQRYPASRPSVEYIESMGKQAVMDELLQGREPAVPDDQRDQIMIGPFMSHYEMAGVLQIALDRLYGCQTDSLVIESVNEAMRAYH